MSAELTTLIGGILLAVDLAIRITALIIVPRNRKPTAAMAWLLAIFLIPFVGIILFLLIGNSRLPKSRRNKQRDLDKMISERAQTLAPPPESAEWPDWFASLVRQNQTLGALPALGGNTADLIADYQASIDAMTREIETATRFVHVEFYIVSFDTTTTQFFGALEGAVQRGVSVRLLADFVASRRVANHDQTFAELDRIGVQWSYMLPVRPFQGQYQRPDLRNHRKLVVVDGRVGFMGSQNLIDRSYNSAKNLKRGLQWQELVTGISGPVVAAANAVFISDWYIETGELLVAENVPAVDLPADTSADAVVCQVVPSGPGYRTRTTCASSSPWSRRRNTR